MLVNGAVGGVGSAAVQLAVARGARVIGTAGPANHEYLRSLGVEPVAYGAGLVERVRALAPNGVDAALDVAGSGVLPELIEVAGGPEHVVTVGDFDGAKEHGVTFSSGSDAGRAVHAIADIGGLIEAGRFSLPVAQTFPLAEIAHAQRISENGHVRGKNLLSLESPRAAGDAPGQSVPARRRICTAAALARSQCHGERSCWTTNDNDSSRTVGRPATDGAPKRHHLPNRTGPRPRRMSRGESHC